MQFHSLHLLLILLFFLLLLLLLLSLIQIGPTELPEAVAAFHSLVGLAATFTAVGDFMVGTVYAAHHHRKFTEFTIFSYMA